MIKKIRNQIIYYFLSFFLFSSCLIKQDEVVFETVQPKTEVLLQVHIPDPVLPQTKALSATEEEKIESLDILIFKNESGVETYAYRVVAHKIDRNNQTYTFSAHIFPSTGTEQFRFVLLTNMRKEIEEALPTLSTSDNKETTLQKINFKPASRWGKTPESGASPYLPMWGESLTTYYIDEYFTGAEIPSISLLRAIARINIGLNMLSGTDNPQGVGTFKIEEIQMRNVSLTGRLNPISANLSGGKVIAPSVIPGTGEITFSKTSEAGVINQIYLAETDGASNPCILMSGYYTAPGQSNATLGWYKIELFNQTKVDPYNYPLDLLRNHYYRLNITAVVGPGYNTADEAYRAQSSGIITQLNVYDENGLVNYVVYNNSYMLATTAERISVISQGTIYNQIYVQTSYTGGWVLYGPTSTSDPASALVSWIKNITPTSSSNAGKYLLRFDTETNNTSNTRSAWFHFSAGSLVQSIRVDQVGP